MIAATLVLAMAAQAGGPPPAAAAGGEVVVVARRIGRTTLLWDMAGDGRLTNCRVFRSSGSAAMDRDACTAPPPCPKGEQCLTPVSRVVPATRGITPGGRLPRLDMSRLKPLPAPARGSAGPKLSR